MHVLKELMWREILETFLFSRWTKQGLNKPYYYYARDGPPAGRGRDSPRYER